MEIREIGPSTTGAAPYFQGTVLLDLVADGSHLDGMTASFTRFLPGARTAWHTHARGQVLHITEGVGLVQSRGGPIHEVRAGDTIHIAPGESHWHGATPDHFMTHLALWVGAAGLPDGVPETSWAEPVGHDEYTGAPRTRRPCG